MALTHLKDARYQVLKYLCENNAFIDYFEVTSLISKIPNMTPDKLYRLLIKMQDGNDVRYIRSREADVFWAIVLADGIDYYEGRVQSEKTAKDTRAILILTIVSLVLAASSIVISIIK